jgi:quinol monooxygenase YgiN
MATGARQAKARVLPARQSKRFAFMQKSPECLTALSKPDGCCEYYPRENNLDAPPCKYIFSAG